MTATTERERIPLAQARALADDLVEYLTPCCERIEIVGSVRRGADTVKDIELLAIPMVDRIPADLFGTQWYERDLLAEEADRMLALGLLEHRLGKDGKRAWGAKYKRAIYAPYPGTRIALDLFAATKDTWGLLQVIRTGPAEFSHRLVTQRQYGGCLPFGTRVVEGRLLVHGEPVATPDERAVFRALDMAYVEPEDR